MSQFAQNALAEARAKQTPAQRLAAVFDAKQEQLQRVMPRLPHLDFGRVRELVCIAYADPASPIHKCSADSVFMAAREAVAVGLDPVTKSLGHAWLVPYNGQASFQIGYKGYLALAHRSRRVSRIAARAVYQDELATFECDPGAGILRHPWRPGVKRDPSDIVAAYCAAWIDQSPIPVIEILDRDQIESRRMRNPAERKGRHSPWKTDYEPMAIKSAVRALFSKGLVPLATEDVAPVSEAIYRDAILDGDIEDLEAADCTVLDQQMQADQEKPDDAQAVEFGGITQDMVTPDEWERMTQGGGDGR